MSQTTITRDPELGIAGTFADATFGAHETVHAIATATITVGTVVAPDGDGGVKPVGSAGDVNNALGVAIRGPNGGTSYASGDNVIIARAGVVWMSVEDTSGAIGGEVFVRHSGAGTDGRVAGTNTANHEPLADARFQSTQGTADGLIKVTLGGTFR